MKNTIELSKEALKLFEAGKYKEALSLYYLIMSQSFDDTNNHYNIAITYEVLGEYELAVAHYRKSIQINNKNVRSINNLARIYMDIVKENEVALQYLDYAIKIAPNDAEAYNLYGIFHTQKQDYNMAEAYFKKAILLDENFFKNYYDLAQAYLGMGDKTKAAEALKKSLELKPNFKDAAELLERVNSSI